MTRTHQWCVAAALLGAAGCHAETVYEKPITPVGIAVATEASADNASRYSATVDAVTKVDLAFRVGGYVRSLGTIAEGRGERPLREGDHVRKGAALATVDQTDNSERVRQLRAQLEEATAASAQAERTLARAQALFAKDALARPELEAAQTAADAARARVAAAGAGARQVEAVLGDHTLVAPFDGILLKKTVNVGALAVPGVPVFSLADISSVKAVFGVPDVALAGVRASAVEVQADAYPGVVFPARLTNVAPAADPRGRVFDVELTIANGDGRLRPGMIASVEVRREGETAAHLLVPLSAVTRPAGGSTGYAVFVVEGDGASAVVRQREVDLGELRGNLVTVSRGLRKGDRVVVSGTAFVTDGAAVRIVV
jgi:multidrug efflux system membrane fusion protein